MKYHSSKLMAPRIGGLMFSLAVAAAGAQTPDPASAQGAHTASNAPAALTDTAQMQQELPKLRDQVRRLEQRMQSYTPSNMQQGGRIDSMRDQNKGWISQSAKPEMKMGDSGMRMMDDDTDLSMNDMKSGSSMSMPSGGMGMMQMMEMMHSKMRGAGMMGIGAMGGMNSPAAMATPSALPGFPGQSHLYHIGATDFYLDHPQHITLTTPQQQTLAQYKQQSLLKQGELQRQVDAAEQELWQLTGADQPQIGNIETKVREIQRLRGDQRVEFIRAVGEAAKVLTDEQCKQLTGMAPARSITDRAPMSAPDDNKSKSDSMGHM